MNEPPPVPASPSPPPAGYGIARRKHGLRWSGWLLGLALLLVIGTGVIWLLAEEDTSMTGQVERALERTRRDERNERHIYAAAEVLYELPEPFHKIARWIRQEDPDEEWEDLEEKLRALGDEAGPILLRLLEHDPNSAVRGELCAVIGHFAGIDPLPVLTNLLTNDVEEDVRWRALDAAVDFDPERAAPAVLAALTLEKSDYLIESVFEQLPELGALHALEPLLAELENLPNTTARRVWAANALGDLGDSQAVPALRKTFVSEDQELVRACAIALGKMRDEESLPRVTAWFEAQLEQVRAGQVNQNTSYSASGYELAENVEAIAKFRDPKVTALLTNALQVLSGSYEKTTVATALGDTRDPMALEPLLAAYSAVQNEWERGLVMQAIAKLDTPAVVPALLGLLSGSSEQTPEFIEALTARPEAQVTPVLREMLLHAEGRQREIAALVLGMSGDPEVLPILLEAVANGDFETQQAAVKALGMVADPATVPVLLALLTGSEPGIKQEVAWALGYIADDRAVPDLITALKDDDFYVRFAAAFALAAIQDPVALEPLQQLLKDRETHVRVAAACSLSFHGSDAGLEQLRTSLRARGDGWHRFAAIVGLLRLNNSVARELLEHAPVDPADYLQALRETGLREGAPVALSALLRDGDEDYRHYAARVLPYFRDPQTVEALRAATVDADAEVRSAARVAALQIERHRSGTTALKTD